MGKDEDDDKSDLDTFSMLEGMGDSIIAKIRKERRRDRVKEMRQHLEEDEEAQEAVRDDQELYKGSLVRRREAATTLTSYCGPARGILTLCFATEAVRDDHE